MEGGVSHGPANAVHRRSPSRRAVDYGAVRALRHLAQDGVQVDRPLPAARAGGLGGALAESDVRRDRERDPGGPAPPPQLGRQEALGPVAEAPSSLASAGALHGVRHPEPAWDGPASPSPSPHRTPRQTDEPDSRAQRW